VKDAAQSGWETKTLGEVAAIVNGGTPKSKVAEYWGGGVQWLTPKDMGQMDGREIAATPRTITDAGLAGSSARLAPAGSVILSTRAPIGHLAMNTVPMAFNQGCRGVVPSEKLDPIYLFHFLDMSRELLNDLGTGTTFKELSSSNLKSVKIPLPPLEEQQRIVAVLDETFEGLARARAHAEANLQNARELFENYREDFLTPSRRQGWSYKKLDDLITIKHGFAFKSAFFVAEGQYAVLTPGNYHETGGFRDRGGKQRYYSGEFPSEFLLRKGDLLMAMTEQAPGLLGSCMIVPEHEGYLHNQRLGLISPKDGVAWSTEYFSQAFNLKAFRKGLSDTCSGATVRHTSPGRILAESIPYSNDKAELETIAIDLAEREQDCRTLENAYCEKLQDLDDLRQSLLQKAFAGELT
jgi:type I restriction enzyme S subunit